ncbi:ATP-binding protein [Verrucomicrobiales bacterium]|jgi:signal transduction histidine kinase|nr:ATP-binding protein [Verrucomicrobiales bacterium]
MTTEELQALNYHWRLAIDQIQEGICILQGGIDNFDQLRIVFANRALESQLKLEPARLEGVALSELFLKEERDRFREDWLKSDPQHAFHGVYTMRTLTGDLVEAEWEISSRAGGENREADHTATLRWRSSLDQPAESSDDPNETIPEGHAFELSKADTIAHIAKGIVHDFNNSLTTIRGHLEVAMPGTKAGSSVHDALEQALEAAMTTSELCQRLLNYAKGRRSTKRPCAVHDVLHQAVAITGLGSNVTCKRVINPNIWPILADSIEIVQVINNLLVNAQQAMPSGGTIALMADNVPVDEASPLGLPPGSYVTLTVRDRGVGIPEEDRKHIFESLYTTKPSGSGLGLATCAQIVSGHNGYIDVHSEPNRGSEFVIYLPAVPEAFAEISGNPQTPPTAAEGAALKPASLAHLKILVVEDQAGISKIAQMYLEQIGHVVVCTADGNSAIDTYRDAWQAGDAFDLALIDLTLPGGMNGEDTFRELRSLTPHIVGIATSGSLDKDSLAEYQAKGFASILPKPFALKALGDVVEEAMLFHTV